MSEYEYREGDIEKFFGCDPNFTTEKDEKDLRIAELEAENQQLQLVKRYALVIHWHTFASDEQLKECMETREAVWNDVCKLEEGLVDSGFNFNGIY